MRRVSGTLIKESRGVWSDFIVTLCAVDGGDDVKVLNVKVRHI